MLTTDEIFLTDSYRAQAAQWKKYEQMYLGAYIHNKIIDTNGNRVNIQPLIPLPMVASNISSDLLFGEPPVVDTDNETTNTTIADWRKTTKFDVRMLENAAMLSALGQMWLHVYMLEGKTDFVMRKPQEAVSTESMYGLEKILFYNDITKKMDGSYTYSIEEHRYEYRNEVYASALLDPTRKYVIERYKITVDRLSYKVKAIYDVQPIENTGLDTITISKVVNMGIAGCSVGLSDYAAKEQMFAEIDNRVDQINYVLQENGDPWIMLPTGVLDQNGAFRRSQGKLIEKGGGGTQENSVDVVQWDASLSAAFEQVKQLIKLLFFTLRISAPIAGIDDTGGNVESGRALKWKSISTFSMVRRKRVYMEQMFNDMFRFMGILSSEFSGIDPNELTYTWNDGLPLDSEAEADTAVKLVDSGLMSHKTGIQKVQEIDEGKAQTELEQIGLEKGAAADLDARRFRVGVE
jgi:hypothetical protein